MVTLSGAGHRLRASFSNARHHCMYDARSLKKALTSHGFTDVRECKIGHSGISQFDEVEDPDRFIDVPSDNPELAFHCVG